MSDGAIIRIIPLAPAQIVDANGIGGINAAFPATNLADIQPKTVLQTNATVAASYDITFTIDLLADTTFDAIATLFSNQSPAGTWEVRASPASAGGYVALTSTLLFSGSFGVAPTTRETRRHALWISPNPVTFRYLRFFIVDTNANPEQMLRLGVIAVGNVIRTAYNFELGSGRRVEDQSITRVLPGGETAIQRGGRTPVWRATWSNITDAEMRGLWSLLLEIGTGAPLIICEDVAATAGQNEGIHYGLLTGLDFNERAQPDKQRIDLTIREMT